MWSKTLALGGILGALLCVSTAAHGQQPADPNKPQGDPGPPGKLSLEELMAKALKQNPDILVAEAKVRLAEVELNQVRQQILAKVAMAYAEVKVAQVYLQEAEVRLERARVLYAQKAIPKEDLTAQLLAVEKYQAELTKRQLELQALVGKKMSGSAGTLGTSFSADGKLLYTMGTDGAVRVWDASTGKLVTNAEVDLKSSAADNLRKALDQPVKVKADKIPLRQVLKDLEATTKVNIVWFGPTEDLDRPLLMALPNEVALGGVLQLVEDLYGVQFFVREYGLVAAQSDLPLKNAVRLHQFWKHNNK
jgi:hypothetical protein